MMLSRPYVFARFLYAGGQYRPVNGGTLIVGVVCRAPAALVSSTARTAGPLNYHLEYSCVPVFFLLILITYDIEHNALTWSLVLNANVSDPRHTG
jgi:hypothetical protein